MMRPLPRLACLALALACTSDDGQDTASETGGATESSGATAAVTTASAETTGATAASADSTASTGGGRETGTVTSSDGADDESDATGSPTTTTGAVGDGGSISWLANPDGLHDYGHQLQLPPTFGVGEFTFQMWIKPDESLPVGSTAGDGTLTNWSSEDEEPYAAGNWWYRGNFLLDGHNNVAGFSQGTFSLQFYGGGRVRWLFGDGSVISGGVWSAGAYPATETASLLDGNWHQLTLVRRWSGASDADLELWIDGTLVDSETSTARTDMRQYWDDWAGFGGDQDGWFWAAEKQAAIGDYGYEDYKGLMAEVRFWDVPLSNVASSYADAVTGDEPGLVGYYPWTEGAGTQACDVLSTDCVELVRTPDEQWLEEGPPLQ